MTISILFAASNTLANHLLCQALGQRRKYFKVLATVHTRKDLLEKVAEHQPDVVLVSANLENEATGGLQVLRELNLIGSSARFIVLLDCSDAEHVVDAFSHGARGVFCLSENFPALCKCIRCVHAGQIWADSGQLHWIIQALESRGKIHIANAQGKPILTDREEQIVRMVAEGLPNGEICTTLGLSSHTVKNHLFNIYNKLGISSRAELVLYAISCRDATRSGDDPPKE
ncbi:MAG TPA: response regulator transcription factor [Spirochaetia bacterium]|nr:response regulator transcription factor [Spirochaetia bacterium]